MNDATFRILGIAGSLRRRSSNRGLIRAAQEVALEGVVVETFDLHPIPLYDGDVAAEVDPAPVVELAQRVAGAHALLIATPEYNSSIPGVLKNAIDWLCRPPAPSVLRQKPVAIMGSSGGPFGTLRAQTDLRKVLHTTGCLVLPNPQIYVPVASQRFDEQGNLTDEQIRGLVRALLVALVDWARRLRAG